MPIPEISFADLLKHDLRVDLYVKVAAYKRGCGRPRCSMFFEHLADADDPALKRLRAPPFSGLSAKVLGVARGASRGTSGNLLGF